MQLNSSKIAYEVFSKHMVTDVEEVWAIALSSNLSMIKVRLIFKGTVDSCSIHPRDIFRFAISENASKIIIAHNHPSDDPYPSAEDVRITKQLIQASQLLELPIVDHLILSKNTYSSMADLGII